NWLYGMPVPGSFRFTAVNSTIALIAFGASGGRMVLNASRFAPIANAATPLATPAAMLVPLNVMYAGRPEEPGTRNDGYVVASVLPGAIGAINRYPGATTSGFAKASYHVGPREL